MLYNYLVGRFLLNEGSENEDIGQAYDIGLLTYAGSMLNTVTTDSGMKNAMLVLGNILMVDQVRVLMKKGRKRWDIILHHIFTCGSMYHYSLFSKNIDVEFPQNITCVESVSSFPLSYHLSKKNGFLEKKAYLRKLYKISMPIIYIWRVKKTVENYWKGVCSRDSPLNKSERIVQGICGAGLSGLNIFWLSKILMLANKK